MAFEMLAKGPGDYYFAWNPAGYGSELVLADGLLYARKFFSTSDGKNNESSLSVMIFRAE